LRQRARDIVAEARAAREVILTHDLDYGSLSAFSGDRYPSVIIFRLKDLDHRKITTLLENSWPSVEVVLQEGAIVILEETGVRIRPLPIRKPGADG
jgi:predicted nuclease of predicted toxin-antitoxin system